MPTHNLKTEGWWIEGHRADWLRPGTTILIPMEVDAVIALEDDNDQIKIMLKHSGETTASQSWDTPRYSQCIIFKEDS